MRIFLVVFGVVLLVVGTVAALLVFDMFQHPRGMGAEIIVGPMVGFVAAGFLFGGSAAIYAAWRQGYKTS
ncbi:MAG: hypothetical protein JOZ10_04370 [Acidobacteria bacterium]|nr:hypothetical protein [Acidobacteriota bacterium]